MISIQGLTKRFGGMIAVDNLSLEIPTGMIVGLLGPNGAGKTTTLRMVTGMLKPDAGTAFINGIDVVKYPVDAKRLLGFVPDSGAVYEALTGLEFLLMIASLYGVSEEKAVPRIWQFLNLFEMDEDTLTKKLLGTYSKGTRRKIVIIAALMHNPQVVLLDEPLDGLDPNAAVSFKALLESLAQEGKTIVYSSHILDVVERVCDRVAIMVSGRVVVEGTPAELLATHEMDTLESLFTGLTGQTEVEARAQIFRPQHVLMNAAATAAMRKRLRITFWKLIFRGRSAEQMRAYQKRKRFGVATSLIFYSLFGLFPATAALTLDPLTYASLLHACTLMFASLTLASNGITTLFMKEEAEVLLHRPVPPEELLRAKISVLTVFSLVLAFSLNIAGLIGGLWTHGLDWRFIPVHIASTSLLMIFATSSMVLAYNACLKWIGPERLDNQISTVQAIVIICMLVGGLALPGFMGPQPMQHLKVQGFGFILPPVWFGALDALLCGAADWQGVLFPALLAVGSTVFITWAAFKKLGSAYGVGLLALNEGGVITVRPREDREPALSALLKLPPFSWWLEDAVERHIFMLVSAYMARDREMKLKLYPGIAPFLVMPLAMLFSMSRVKQADAMIWVQAFAACYLAIVPLQAMLLLNRSEHWRAAGFFHTAPVRHWSSLFHGARKAVLCWLTYPLVLLLGLVMAILQQSIVPLAMVLPALVFLPAFSLVPGLGKVWLPLSLPVEDQQDVGNGCLLMAVVGGLAIVIGGVATWMWKLGGAWFLTFLTCEALVMLGIYRLGKEEVEKRLWEPES